MGRRRIPAAAAAACALAACAALDPELTAARESWRGATYEQVLAVWGPPVRTVGSPSQQNHTWVTEERVERAGAAGGVGGAIFASGGSGRCERTLVFRNARVVDEDWSGDPEFCKRFARRR